MGEDHETHFIIASHFTSTIPSFDQDQGGQCIFVASLIGLVERWICFSLPRLLRKHSGREICVGTLDHCEHIKRNVCILRCGRRRWDGWGIDLRRIHDHGPKTPSHDHQGNAGNCRGYGLRQDDARGDNRPKGCGVNCGHDFSHPPELRREPQRDADGYHDTGFRKLRGEH